MGDSLYYFAILNSVSLAIVIDFTILIEVNFTTFNVPGAILVAGKDGEGIFGGSLQVIGIEGIILGVISKTAPQVNVFQLSFLFKPVLGAAIMIWILPMLINVISEFFTSCSSIY